MDYVNKFEFADGTKFDWNNPEHAKDPFTNRDPRLYETVLVNGDYFQGRTAQLYRRRLTDADRGAVERLRADTALRGT